MLLGNRYIDDNITEWELNSTHIQYREKFIKKIEAGQYKTEIVSTCLCGGKSFEQLTAKDRFGLPFGNVICKSCGLLICTPRLQEQSLPEFYNEIYHGLVFGSENVQDFEHMVDKQQGMMIFEFLKKHLESKKNFEIAEIGAGVGNNLKSIIDEAKKLGINVIAYGCEYSEACVRFGKEKYGLNIVQGGTDSIVKLNKKFDLVIMSHVLEHFTDPIKELARIKQILKEDGMVYVEVPGVLDLHNKPVYQCDFLRYTVLAHMYNFSLGTLTNIMGLAGFKLIKGTEFVRSLFQLSANSNFSILNYYYKITEYLKNQEHNRRIFYEFNLNKMELSKIKSVVDSAAKSLRDRDNQIQNLQTQLESINQLMDNIKIQAKHAEEEFSKQLQKLEEEHKNIVALSEQRLAQLHVEKERSELELKSEIARLQEERRKLELETEKKLFQSQSEKLKIELDFKQKLEQARADNQAIEKWFKDQIVQIIAEKKNNEAWYKKQLENIQTEKTALIKKQQAESNELQTKLNNIKVKYDNLAYWHNVIVNSLSWKLTAPLRKIKELIFPNWKG